jgi:predicted DNA-binding transcriptional regulator AlpA
VSAHILTAIYAMLVLSVTNGVMALDNDTILIDVREAARLLAVGRSTLLEWSRSGHGPRLVDVGRPGAKRRTIRMLRSEVERFARGNHE